MLSVQAEARRAKKRKQTWECRRISAWTDRIRKFCMRICSFLRIRCPYPSRRNKPFLMASRRRTRLQIRRRHGFLPLPCRRFRRFPFPCEERRWSDGFLPPPSWKTTGTMRITNVKINPAEEATTDRKWEMGKTNPRCLRADIRSSLLGRNAVRPALRRYVRRRRLVGDFSIVASRIDDILPLLLRRFCVPDAKTEVFVEPLLVVGEHIGQFRKFWCSMLWENNKC